MARSMDWWVLATAAVALVLSILVLLYIHGPAGIAIHDDPFSAALLGKPEQTPISASS